MRLIRLILLISALGWPCAVFAGPPVTFNGEGVTIIHDGSQTAYDPHTEAGRLAIRATRGICCVEAPAHWHGLSAGFAFNGDIDHNLIHEARRFAVNPRTGAFVSSTTLEDAKYPVTDPRRYVDSDMTPMVGLSAEQVKACNCKPGDRVLVSDAANHVTLWAVYGDNVGDQEDGLAFTGLSTAAAQALHIPLDSITKDARQIDYHFTLTIYPDSGYGPHFPHGGLPPVKENAG